MGTSVNLKNRFAGEKKIVQHFSMTFYCSFSGTGYNIELVVQRDNVQQMKDFVTSQLTGEFLGYYTVLY